MSQTKRKNGWQLAELAEEATPDGMQRFLNTAHWDADEVRADLQQYVLTHLADPEAVLVVDETGFLKKGSKSVGVAAQYTGTAGKIANCQIGVFLAYATRNGPVLIDRELYLHQDWEKDPQRCQEADVPEERRATVPKPTMVKEMLARAFAHGVKAAWVTGDTVYGGDYKLRSWLEERLQAYVLAVPKNQRIGLSRRADEVVATWPAEYWQRVSAGEGSQGPRFYDWAWQSLDFRWTEPGWKQWLLSRRSVSDPTKIAYYFVFAPESVSLEQVVRAAGSRWQVEESFELAKQQVGLDEYEVRHWQGWYRHITLAMFASSIFDGGQSDRAKKGAQFQEQEAAQLLPLTVPEVRRLLWRLVWQAPATPEGVFSWSRWRRRHQARSKQFHIKRRAIRPAT